MIEIWIVDLVRAGPALLALEKKTARLEARDAARQEVLVSADVEHTATQAVASHIALRLLIERVGGPQLRQSPIVRSRHGRPHLPDTPIHFSLSRARGLALIAVGSCGPLGVDIERERSVLLSAERQAAIEATAAMLNAEQALPAPSQSVNARFLQSWVRLEAFAKADGRGIGHLLTTLGIAGSRAWQEKGGVTARAAQLAQSAEWLVSDLDIGHAEYAAVALPKGTNPPEARHMPAVLSELECLAG